MVYNFTVRKHVSPWRNYIHGDKWSTGYHGQSIAFFDDFRRNSVPWDQLLRSTDIYYASFEQKCIADEVPWVPEYVIFTCVASPQDCFTYTGVDGSTQLWDGFEQFDRRITHIIHCLSPGQFTLERGVQDEVSDLVLPENIVPTPAPPSAADLNDID